STPEVTAFVNGVMVRYLDFNDTYLSREPLHPSDMIPALMALAEWRRCSPRDFIAAVAVAYEVGVTLCDAASLRAHGWDHVNYIAVGTACGAARLLGLTPSQTEHAIAIATVPHAALRQTRAGELSMWKGAAAANAARNAVFAALLAEAGMTGPFQPFAGEMGFFRQLLGGETFDEAALQGLVEGRPPRRILDTYIKYWPVEYHAQSAVDAALQLRRELGDPAQVAAVHIDTFRAAYEIIAKDPEKWEPRTRETADHSLPYIVAVALLDGRVNRESFSSERIQDPRVRDLLKHRVTLREDPDLTSQYPEGIPNRITVKTSDGRTLSREVRYPRGHARNPMTDEEVLAKFRANVAAYWTAEQADRVADLVLHLEELSEWDEFMTWLRV
ncbi:MAG: MmgE/PrpD family protein, partial [Acidobacteria bacterium]|nr:MmgE/PrpD family protein [Acidobacteriota bacterium]